MASFKPLILAVLIAYVSYQIIQEPIPEGCAQPVKLRLLLSFNRFLESVAGLLHKSGVCRHVNVKKTLTEYGGMLFNRALDGVTTKDAVFDGVAVRIFTPTQSDVPPIGMVYYHGGGWTIGSISTHGIVTAFLAKESNMVVVSVEYRLNPEHSQKDGLRDCVKATTHFIDHAHTYGVDPGRVAVAGDSAGGNYAAAVSLVLRDRGFSPMPKLQVLIYPTVQGIDLQLPSYQQNFNGPFLTRHDMCLFKSIVNAKNMELADYFDSNTHVTADVRKTFASGVLDVALLPKEHLYPPYKEPEYTPGDVELWEKLKGHFLDPYMYPLMAEDHSNLPATYIFTAQYDQLRDDGYLYAARLEKFGVEVTHFNSLVGWHGMINFLLDFTDAKDIMVEISRFVKKTL